MSSSYENVFVESLDDLPPELLRDLQADSDDDDDLSTWPSISEKFRRVPIAPSLASDRDKVGRCSRTKGHVLVIDNKEIRCTNCPARWRNEGF